METAAAAAAASSSTFQLLILLAESGMHRYQELLPLHGYALGQSDVHLKLSIIPHCRFPVMIVQIVYFHFGILNRGTWTGDSWNIWEMAWWRLSHGGIAAI